MTTGLGICNYNRSADVYSAVQAALDQTRPPDLVIVLDNASTDDSVEQLRSRFSDKIEILANPANTGGAGGFSRISQELLERSFDSIVLLDSDCFLRPDAIERMLAAFESDPSIGICGARIMHEDQPQIIQECGAFLDWDNASFRLNHRDQRLADSQLPEFEFVDYVPACALAARREVLESIGHFDPSYFIYFDDIEWCHRAAKAGFLTAVANRAGALHKGGGKVKTTHFSTYYFWRNRIRFFQENAPDKSRARTYLLENASRAIATSETLGQPSSAAIIRAALLDALSHRYGQKCFDGIKLALDPPSPHLLAADATGPTQNVSHIFAPSDASDDTILQDPFGKRMLAKQSRQNAPAFQAALQQIASELSSIA